MTDTVQPLSLKKNMLWNSLGSMFYLGCQWLITVLVVRLSTSFDAAGLLSLATSVVNTFGTFANYKIGTYQVSDINRQYSFSEYMGFRAFTLALAFIACLIYAVITCPAYSIATVIIYYIYKAVGLIIDILHGENQLNRRMDYIGKSFILQGSVSVGAFIVVFIATQNLNLAIIGMTLSVTLVLLFFDRKKTSQFQDFRARIGIIKALNLLKTSLPAVIASVAASALFTIPKQYLLSVSGDAALGIYSSIAAPALIVQMGAQYLYVPLLDIFPKKYFNEGRKAFDNLLVRTVISILTVAALCCIALLFLGKPLLMLVFGNTIEPYVYLLQPVLISTIMTAFLWFFSDLLITIRDFKANLIGNLIAFISVIPLSVFCINNWGMNGVSIAGAVSCGLGVCYLFYALKRNETTQEIPNKTIEE